jgi:hypothetical protein
LVTTHKQGLQHKSKIVNSIIELSNKSTFSNPVINSVSSPPINNKHTMIPDTGCSGHYFMNTAPVSQITPAKTSLKVSLPNGHVIQSTHSAYLNIPGLPASARECHIFPELTSGSLLSIGLLCDHDCDVNFRKHKVHVIYEGKEILTGSRDYHNGLWSIDMPTPQTTCNSITPTIPNQLPTQDKFTCNAVTTNVTKTVADRVAFYHASLFSPTISTWCKAIDAGHFTTWPELTSKKVRTHLPTSIAMLKGHLDQTRANAQSTRRPHIPGHLFYNQWSILQVQRQLQSQKFHHLRNPGTQ